MKWLFFLLLIPLIGMASYTGNPGSPALLSRGLFGLPSSFLGVHTGYLFDYMDHKKLLTVQRPEEASSLAKEMHLEMEAHLSYLSVSLLKRMEVYSFLGITQEKMKWEAHPQEDSAKLKIKPHFIYAIGSKFILLDFGSTLVGLDVQWFRLPSLKKLTTIFQSLPLTSLLAYEQVKWKEWHAALGISTRLGPFSPYLGGKYSRTWVTIRSKKDLPSLKMRAEKKLGLFLGLSLTLTQSFYLSGEMRFFDEKATSIQVTSSF